MGFSWFQNDVHLATSKSVDPSPQLVPDQVGAWTLHIDDLPWHLKEVALHKTRARKSQTDFSCAASSFLPEVHWTLSATFYLVQSNTAFHVTSIQFGIYLFSGHD